MLFSNLVATLRADLDAIKDDLDEFVTTVKTDTTAMLGLDPNTVVYGHAGGTGESKYLEWEEVLWDNPELLCENPTEPEWETFMNSSPLKEEEVELLLSGAASDIVPELYRELVPSRATHADFFRRLFYHKHRLNQAARVRMQNLVKEEEETRWEDDDSIDDSTPVPQTKPQEEEKVSRDDKGEELKACQAELSATQKQMREMMVKITELQSLLEMSEAKRKDLENKVHLMEELPHKKPALISETKSVAATSTPVVSTPENEISKPNSVPIMSATSWEALPSSPTSSSNEEPVVVTKIGSNDEEEEDDWE